MQKVAGSIPVSSTSQPLAKQGVVSFLEQPDQAMKSDTARVIDGRRALLCGLFASVLVSVAAFFVLRILPIALFVGVFIGFPTGFAASFGSRLTRVVAWSAGFWGLVAAVIQPELLIIDDFGGLTRSYFLAQVALLLAIVSIAGLCGGCAHIVCRAIPPRSGKRQPFQYTLAEVLMVSFLFASCFAFGAWFAKLDAVQIARYRGYAAHGPAK